MAVFLERKGVCSERKYVFLAGNVFRSERKLVFPPGNVLRADRNLVFSAEKVNCWEGEGKSWEGDELEMENATQRRYWLSLNDYEMIVLGYLF